MAVSEQQRTPKVLLFDKSKSILLPESPTHKAIEETPHTSTPVAQYKLAHQSTFPNHCDITMLSSIPLTYANSDFTVNYGPVLDMTTSQVLKSVHTSIKFHHPDKVEERALNPIIVSKTDTTSQSPTMNHSASSMQSTFLYPGSLVHKYCGSSQAEISSGSKTDLATTTHKQEDASESVVNIKESPPNSQGSVMMKSDYANDPGTKSTKVFAIAQVPLVHYTSQDSGPGRTCDEHSSPPNLKIMHSEQAVTPVLFDTPGCIDGVQSLATKLLQFQSSHLPQSQHVEDDADYDNDKTPPISPEDKADEEPTAGCEVKQNEGKEGFVDNITDLSKKKGLDATSVTYAKLRNNAERSKESMLTPGKKCVAISEKQYKESDTALGQPRTKRVNTRMASRKSMAVSTSRDSIRNKKSAKESAKKEDDDFVYNKRTPRKQVTTESQVCCVLNHCYCTLLL